MVYNPVRVTCPRRRWYAGTGGGLALMLTLLLGQPDHARSAGAETTPAPKAPAAVQVVSPKRSTASSDVLLPGTTQAVQEASLFARTSGYVRRRLVDIGDRVTAGQVLAEIESPEVDQELLQARATLLQARATLGQARATLKQVQANIQQAKANLKQVQANTEMARVTAERWQQMEKDGVLPRQQSEEKVAAYAAAQANVSAAQANVNAVQESANAVQAQGSAQEATVQVQEANVRRLETLQSFQKITAPFAGVITARTIDVGALITAGSSTTSRELFRLAQIDILRVFVNVPQTMMMAVRPGQEAQILVRELPHKTFAGKIARTTNALDAASRTLPIEVQVPNPELALLPGMYAQVKLSAVRSTPPLLVPSNALVIRAEGTQVATVRKDQTVHYQKVQVERDYGTEVEISSGLNGDEALVVNPTSDLQEGASVQVIVAQKKDK